MKLHPKNSNVKTNIWKLFLFLFFINNGLGFTQTTTEKRDENKREKTIHGNRFRLSNNYVNVGIGIAEKFSSPTNVTLPVAAGYNFRVKKVFFQAGYMRSEMPVIWGKYTANFINDIHFAYCQRRENRNINFSYIFGPSYVFGLLNNERYSHLGFYAEAHLIRKIFYDIGIGIAPFFSYNVAYPIGGIRLEFFFSSSYQGQINAE